MFGITLGKGLIERIAKLEWENNKLKEAETDLENALISKEKKIFELESKIGFSEREYQIRENNALQKLRDEMSKRLIESDIAKAEAIAKLEVYEKMDTKDDSNTIKESIGKLIEQIGKQNVNVIK